MSQAITLCDAEINQPLAHLATVKHEARNRAMVLLTHLAGMRVGEVACLHWSDVTKKDGTIKAEIRLITEMTQGRLARTVFINSKLQSELQSYADQAKCIHPTYPFFGFQKSI